MADLIATDPAWARAAAQLAGALDAVAGDLAQLPAPALPDDVAARLDAALRTAGTPHAPAAPATPAPASVTSATTRAPRGPSGHPGGSRRPPAGTGRRRHRMARWGGGLAAAAALVVVAALGLDALGLTDADDAAERTFSAERDLGDDAPAPEQHETLAEPEAAGPRLLATGSDYHSGQLPAGPADVGTFAVPPADQPDDGAGATEDEREAADDPALPVPAELRHLWPLPASCQSAILAGYDDGTRVEVVDYATVDGDAALVVWLTAGEDQRWVSVVGPQCGSPGAGADERHRVRVG